MSSLGSLDQTLRSRQASSEPRIPIENVYSLARLWGGSGTFLEWLSLDEKEPENCWSIDLVRARIAAGVLSRFQETWAGYMPTGIGGWSDLLSQKVTRAVGRTEVPSAHTDWLATASEFGRYPTRTYVERRPTGSYDTAYGRVLKWVARFATRADHLVKAQLGREVLSLRSRAMFNSLHELPQISLATDTVRPSDDDLLDCKSAGGAWLVVARFAEELAAIWFSDSQDQIRTLAPILPELGHQLFELAVLGAVVEDLRAALPTGVWKTDAPIGAARGKKPCLSARAPDALIQIFYQTVPSDARPSSAPYSDLARTIGGGVLRPDIWVEVTSSGRRTQIVIECKFSLDPGYVSSGITQCMSYSVEFPINPGADRLFVAVGPAEVIPAPAADGRGFHLTPPQCIGTLVTSLL